MDTQLLKLATLDLAGEFRWPTGEPKHAPGAGDFTRVVGSDHLINRPPASLAGQLATLGWLDDKLDWVRALF